MTIPPAFFDRLDKWSIDKARNETTCTINKGRSLSLSNASSRYEQGISFRYPCILAIFICRIFDSNIIAPARPTFIPIWQTYVKYM